jgi:hypothetical protein
MIYDVEFHDGNINEHAANTLAENMFSQVNPKGYNTTLLKEIIDYRRDDSAVALENKYLKTRSGQRRLRKTTQGWEVLVAWKDGTESWVRLATLKDLYPVELAEFAKARGIGNAPVGTKHNTEERCYPLRREGTIPKEGPQVRIRVLRQ